MVTPARDRDIEQAILRGSELLKQNRFGDAQQAFRAALLLDSDNVRVLALLGLAYFRAGNFDQSRPIYEDLVERAPTDASHRLNLGLVYLKLGDADHAIHALEASRALDPSQGRAVSYLGLAYARAGRYAEAYRAFLLAGQNDLAAEVEINLTQPERDGIHRQLQRAGIEPVIARTTTPNVRPPKRAPTPPPIAETPPERPTPPPERPTPPPEPSRTTTGPVVSRTPSPHVIPRTITGQQPAVQPERSRTLTPQGPPLVERPPAQTTPPPFAAQPEPAPEPRTKPPSSPPGKPRTQTADLPPEVSMEIRIEPSARPTPPPVPAHEITAPRMTDSLQFVLPASDPVPEAFDGHSMISRAVKVASPSSAATAATAGRVSAGSLPPVPLSQLATDELVRPDDGDHPFEVSPGGALVIRVRERVLTRLDGIHVTGGDLAYEHAQRRSRGHQIEDKFDYGGSQLHTVSGQGYLLALPGTRTFTAVSLDDDIFYLREDLVFAFEATLRWENGNVPGLRGRLPVVQFRGDGAVAIRSDKPLVRVKLPAQGVVYVDATRLAGWIGRVIPRAVVPPVGGPMGEVCVECTGEGVVLVDPVGDPGGLAPVERPRQTSTPPPPPQPAVAELRLDDDDHRDEF